MHKGFLYGLLFGFRLGIPIWVALRAPLGIPIWVALRVPFGDSSQCADKSEP